MKLGLGIPYWGNQPERDRNAVFVHSRLSDMLPWDFIRMGAPNSPTRGSARNWLMSEAVSAGVDVMVLCDADTFPEKRALTTAIGAAMDYGGLHFAYNEYRALTEEATQTLIAAPHTNVARLALASKCLGSLGGVMCMQPAQWFAAGGMPELDGWGFEDIIFAVCARTLIRDNEWHNGWITHLWHPSEVRVGSTTYDYNIGVCRRFENASWDRKKIHGLIAEFCPWSTAGEQG